MKQKLLKQYSELSKLGKFFVWYSIVLLQAIIIIYVLNVFAALAMDPTSYNCTGDSMMMQVCHDPYRSSVGWTILFIMLFGVPFIIAWLIIVIVLIFIKSHHRR